MVTFRWAEPERPESYRTLPRYTRADYWHCMARAVEVKSDDLVEIKRFHDHRLRVFLVGLALLVIAVNIAGGIRAFGSFEAYRAKLVFSYEYVFHFEERTRRTYREKMSAEFKSAIPEDEFLAGMREGHKHRFAKALLFPVFMWTMPIVAIIVAMFLPRFCPVRFDRKRELIYTWWRKRLYIADVGPCLGGLEAGIEAEVERNPLYKSSTGPVGIKMHPINDPAQVKKFRVGTFPVCHSHQNRDLLMFIEAFMSRDLYTADGKRLPWTPDWLAMIERGPTFFFDWIRWLSERALGPKRYFDEAKTEAALLEYLTHPDTRTRGQPAWRRPV